MTKNDPKKTDDIKELGEKNFKDNEIKTARNKLKTTDSPAGDSQQKCQVATAKLSSYS
jgi:hypothetical protein